MGAGWGGVSTREAFAQEAPTAGTRSAAEAFQRGVELLDSDRFAEAEAEFDRSLALRRSATALYNLGLARRGLGHYRAAITALEQVRSVAAPGSRLVPDSDALLTQLRAALVRVTVDTRGQCNCVRVDGAEVAGSDGVVSLELDPGRHVFEAPREGHRTARVERELAAGTRATISLDAAESPLPARLRVESDASDVEIRIDGGSAERGRVETELAAGTHAIEVRGVGRATQRRSVVLVPGGEERVRVPLGPRAVPWIASPWLWVGVGVVGAGVLAGSIGGGVVAATAPNGGTWGVLVQGATWR